MRRSYFAGLLGGRPTQANFIVGYVDDKFVCLDPHLVQPAFGKASVYFETKTTPRSSCSLAKLILSCSSTITKSTALAP